MLDLDTLADIEGDAALLLRLAKLDDDEPPATIALCRALTGRPPMTARIRQEACSARVGNEWRVVVRRGVLPARARWLVGHELAELHYARTGYRGRDIEARCDALGAALCLPRRALLGLVRHHAHRVHAIARLTRLTQSLVLLRIGEVTGRPVALLRAPAPTVRGDAFAWPVEPSLFVPGAHPLRITDEPQRVGLMASL